MVYMFLADGFEEMEALCPVDLLRRGNVEVRTVSVTDKRAVCGAHGIEVVADLFLSELKELPSVAALPGGLGGVNNLGACEAFCKLLVEYGERGVTLAAICAAPTLLSKLSLIGNRRVTCYPSCREQLCEGTYVDQAVCIEEGLITSAGPGTACDFGLALLEFCTDRQKAEEVAAGALLR